jgi:YesN/AraC family two-component response regulator
MEDNMEFDILKNINVLYVEDNDVILSQMEMALGSFVGGLFTAKDGNEALKVFNSNNIDVLITDIKMPNMNGLDLMQEISNRGDSSLLAKIFVTAHDNSDYLLKAITAKADAYIIKPVNIKELLETITNIVTPKIRAKQLSKKNILLAILSTISGKRVKIIEYILNNVDDDMIFYGTYDKIVDDLQASKPTVVNAFKVMLEKGIIKRLKNGVYQISVTIED